MLKTFFVLFVFWVSVAAEKDFVGANLVSVLHKLLSDERSAPEIKYNSMILICAVMGSGETDRCFNQLIKSGLVDQSATDYLPISARIYSWEFGIK